VFFNRAFNNIATLTPIPVIVLIIEYSYMVYFCNHFSTVVTKSDMKGRIFLKNGPMLGIMGRVMAFFMGAFTVDHSMRFFLNVIHAKITFDPVGGINPGKASIGTVFCYRAAGAFIGVLIVFETNNTAPIDGFMHVRFGICIVFRMDVERDASHQSKHHHNGEKHTENSVFHHSSLL